MKKPMLRPSLLPCLFLLLPASAFCASSLFAAETPAPTALARELAAIDLPQAGARVELAGPIVLGSATFAPAAGTAVRQLTCGGQPCGFYLAGPGVFELEVGDRFSRPIAARNLATLAPKLAVGGTDGRLVVRETFRDAVVWRLGFAAPAADGAAGGSPAALPSWLNELLERPFFRRPGVALAAAAGSGSPDAAYALLHGEKEMLRFTFDPLYTGFEALQTLRRDSTYIGVDRDRHFAMELARQPIRRQWWQRFPDPLVATSASSRSTTTRARTSRSAAPSPCGPAATAWRSGRASWPSRSTKATAASRSRCARSRSTASPPTGPTATASCWCASAGRSKAATRSRLRSTTAAGWPCSTAATACGPTAASQLVARRRDGQPRDDGARAGAFIPFGSGKVVSREKKTASTWCTPRSTARPSS